MVLMSTGKEAEFTTKLVKPLVLSKDWEVAITEINLSSNPINFTSKESFSCDCLSDDGQRISEIFHFEEEIITSGDDLISRIKSLGSKSKVFPRTVRDLRWNSRSQKAELELSENSQMKFSPKLAAVLSFDESLEQSAVLETFESKYCVDTRLHFWNLFVYSSIISPYIVGENLLPVIQTILFGKLTKTRNITKIFKPPIFLQLSNVFLPKIDIKICDELGQVLKFPKDCTIICKLLFVNDNLPGGRD